MNSFSAHVLKIVKQIPKGKVVSYGQIALLAGSPRSARQVGWILNQLSDDQTPWWRVINNSGRITIKHEEITAQEQKARLEAEGIIVSETLQIDIKKYRWDSA